MSNQNTKDCCGNTIYNAEAEASGIALTYGNNIVTSSATATASSIVSYNDAENIAYDIASNVAQSVAENNANIITETNRNKKQYIPDINPANFNIFLTPDKSDHKMITLGFDIKLFPEPKKNNIRSSVSLNNNSSVNSRASTVKM